MRNFGGQKISRISVKYMTEIKLEKQKSGEKNSSLTSQKKCKVTPVKLQIAISSFCPSYFLEFFEAYGEKKWRYIKSRFMKHMTAL
jgi:hypothetical protein